MLRPGEATDGLPEIGGAVELRIAWIDNGPPKRYVYTRRAVN
jgi:hypothetical protein